MQAMDSLGIDPGALQETKLTGGIYICYSQEYDVLATNTPSVWQGGVDLFWRECDLFEMDQQKNRVPMS